MQKIEKETDLTQAEYYMQECFDLAKKGLGRTSPNPVVGAIVLDKSGIPCGEGFHAKAGQEHAEVIALKEAGEKADGGTLILNLEPCCHLGKTPPCTDLIIKSKVKEVIFSNYDPNPKVHKKGEVELLKNNIRVISNVLEKQGYELNKFFFKWVKTQLPWVTLKQAQTLDGKVALKSNQSDWITGYEARSEVHKLRDIYDAILVGANTVVIDNPELTVREIKNGRNPIRIVLDPNLATDINSNVYREDANVILVTRIGHKREKIKTYLDMSKTLEALEIDETKRGKIDLKKLFIELGKKNILSVLVEGGPTLASELLVNNLIDEYIVFISPKVFGDKEAVPSINIGEVSNINNSFNFKIFNHKVIGNDLMISLRTTMDLRF